jgi:DNA-binding MarR family transcriptional regulator
MARQEVTDRGSALSDAQPPERQLTDHEYAELLACRDRLRRFTRWSEQQARSVGLTHAQHQLLLVVRGHRDPSGRPTPPTVGDVADHLMLRHHSAVELIDRAEAAGHVQRIGDDDDGRVVRVVLTDVGERRIERLSELHLDELRELAQLFAHLVDHH